MKRFSLIVIAVWCSWMVHAQTDATVQSSPASATTNSPVAAPPTRPPTRIDSDSADFDLVARTGTYRGDVRVDDTEMKLTCAWLVADVPQSGGRPNRIVAETNVVIDFTDTKGQTNHATGDKAVYVYSEQGGVTNETVTLTGSPQPQVENAQGLQAGDVMIWNRENTNSHIRITGNYHMISHQKPGDVMMDTNSPVTVVKTNLPPGTVENIGRSVTNAP